MVEISKETKIVLIIDGVASFLFMILYLIIPELYASMVDPLVFDPYYWRAFGGTLLALFILVLIALKRAEWEQVKVVIELAIIWSSIILILNIWELIALPISPTYIETTIVDSILLVVLIILNAFIYYREQK
ncbi:MAG: hypothetical protein EU532_14220 [Promethearchaeota archaeon]|nr:MAG: hypothetical protein EU532_14220 [Candidatus Lokiarchaeota archaeon]